MFHVEHDVFPKNRRRACSTWNRRDPTGVAPSKTDRVAGVIPEALERDMAMVLERMPGLCPDATPAQLVEWGRQLSCYVRLLFAWSGRTSLVSEQDRLGLASRHLLPSLAMRGVVLQYPRGIVADLGSGSGLPGVPLKITLPASAFQLIEARRRRANFLREVVRKLALEQVEVVNSRVEDWVCPDEKRPHLVVSRATMAVNELVHYCAAILRPGGRVLYRSPSGGSDCRADDSDSPFTVDTGVQDSEGRNIHIAVLSPDASSA